MLLATAVAGMLVGATPSPCTGLDLPAALQRVLERSDEVAIKSLERAGAEADLALARAVGYVPSASATVVTGPAPGAHGTVVQAAQGTSNRSLSDLAPFVRLDVNLVQPLWTWGQLDAARDAASAGVSARNALVADTASQVQLRVARLFWGRALAKRLLVIAGSVDKALVEVDQRLEQANPNDRFRVDVLKAELARRKADAQKALTLSEIGLAATLTVDTRELQLADVPLPTPDDALPELQQLMDRAQVQRPDLAALSFAIEARRAQVRAAEAARLPQLFVAGQFSVAYAPNRDLQTNPWVNDPFREVTAGLVLGVKQNLSIHVLNAEADKARAELAMLERQLEGLHRLVRAQVESSRAELVACVARAQASRAGLTASKSWFRASEMTFGVGVEDAKSLLDAYSSYVQSQVSAATSDFEWVAARAELDQATGAPIAASRGACRAQGEP